MMPFWSGRRVFVTGHTGFKGSWLSLWLMRAGAEVVGYSDGVPTRPALFEVAAVADVMTSLLGDVRDREGLTTAIRRHRPEVVFHLAAQPLVRRSLAEPLLTYETNVLGTANVLEGIRSSGSAAVCVIVTTDKVYAPGAGRPYREADPLGGDDPYSSSKACAELVTAAYRSSYFRDEDAPAVATARAGNVIGGGDWGDDRLVPDIMRAVAAEVPVEIRYPDAVRPWQHVLNALDGYLVLAERLGEDRSLARAWNFGPDEDDARPVRWVIERIGEHLGEPVAVTRPPQEQPPEAMSLRLDATLAKSELGWASRWNLERGLRATVDWYRGYAAGQAARELTLGQIEAFEREREPSSFVR
jgi:CDP-glucose 4,6-dehydratase